MLPLSDLVVPPLLKRRETWFVGVVVALALWGAGWRSHAKASDAALAQRPATHDHTDSKQEKKKEQGRVVVTKKFSPATTPGGKPTLAEERIEKDPSTTTTKKESSQDKTSTPACPAHVEPWRYAGVIVDPWQTSKLVGIRAGVTLWGRFDVGSAMRFAPHTEGQVEVSVRF